MCLATDSKRTSRPDSSTITKNKWGTFSKPLTLTICKDTTKINSDKTFPQKSGSDAPFFLDFHPVFHIFRKIGRPTGLNRCSLPEVFCMNQQRIGEILLLSATYANAETSQTSARCAYPPTIYGTNTPHRRNGCWPRIDAHDRNILSGIS